MKTFLRTLTSALSAQGVLVSSPAAVAEPSTDLAFQFQREVSMDVCSWTDRPINSTCVTVGTSGSPPLACAPPMSPPDTSRPVFYLTASERCPLDPYIGCPRQRWLWSDERMVSGFGSKEIRCPTDPLQWGTGFYTLPLLASRSDHIFMRIPAFFAHQAAKKVRAQVKLRAYSVRPMEPANLPYQPMTAVLALQQLNANNQWVDIATQVIHDETQHTTTYYVYEAEAWVAPFSMVRLELRGGSVPAPRSDKDTEYYMNYHLELDIMDGRVVLPECIPDHSTGTCL